MNHGDHDMPMPARCAMNMLWNTQVIDTCIVFESWHVRTHAQFATSILAIVLLGVLYEFLRLCQRALDARLAVVLRGTPAARRAAAASPPPASGRSTPDRSFAGALAEDVGLLSGRRGRSARLVAVPTNFRILRAALYGASIFLSFFLMLIFMTYNAYLILAVVAGAAIGHYIFGAQVDFDAAGGKGMACH